MRALCQKPGQPEPRGRQWLLAALALALLWPALLAPAHRHPGSAGPVALTGLSLAQDRGAARGQHDVDACAVCRELLKAAAYLAPPAALVMARASEHLPAAPGLATAWRLRRPPAAWRSRAPPLPAPR